jgi:hypothetical protein
MSVPRYLWKKLEKTNGFDAGEDRFLQKSESNTGCGRHHFPII